MKMKAMKQVLLKRVCSFTLAAAMVVGGGGITALAAGDTENNNDATEGYTYEAPTSPMAVDDNIITATAHRAASPILGIIGLNAKSGFGMINGSAPTTLADAVTKPALGIWGTSLNENPDPYYWNFFYNFYAQENGLEESSDALLNPSAAASPSGADTTLVEDYGNISVSLYTRPDIAVGVDGGTADGEATTDNKTGNTSISEYGTSYASQIARINSFTENSEYYQEGDENYSPKLVTYTLTTLETMIDTMKGLASAADEVAKETGKTTRYGDPLIIANDYEKYIYGTQAYILSKIADGTTEKKTVAMINGINEDGTYNLSNSASQSATSKTRIVEYTENVSDNLVDVLGLTDEDEDGYSVATVDQLAQADVIICLDNTNAGLTEDDIKAAMGDKYTGQMLITTSFTTLYGITMNSVENAVGMAYIISYMYNDVLNVSPIEWYAYFAQRFYHISDLTSLQTVIKTNFSNTILPEGMTSDLPSDYSMAKVEDQIAEGIDYYVGNQEAFADTAIPTNWEPDTSSGIGSEESTGETVGVTEVTLDQNTLTLKGTESQTLTATIAPANATDQRLIWTSDNKSVATVNGEGKVTGVGEGKATITVTAQDGYNTEDKKSAQCEVTVEEVAVKNLEIPETLTVDLNGQEALAVTLSPEGATGTVTWTSDKEDVAIVNAAGKVTGKGLGTATITATSGELTDTCEVTVRGVALNQNTLTLTKGEDGTLTAATCPADADVTWSSSKESVATVTSEGKITAVGVGSAAITATVAYDDGTEATATCVVTVEGIPVGSVTLDKTTLSLTEGDTETLTATVAPETAEDKTVTWTSDNEAVATVEGGNVTAVAAGTATITAKSGEQTATCTVTVIGTPGATVAVTGITLNKTSLSLTEGGSDTLTATVAPSDATDKTVTWSSSDTKVATVSGGKVTAVAAGTATITAKAGGKSATCKVTVTAKSSTTNTTDTDNTTTAKKAQTIKLATTSKVLKLKLKNNKTTAKKTFTVKVTGAKTALDVSSSSKKITVKAVGKKKIQVTVKKGTKKGKYKIKVKAESNTKYKASATKTLKLTIKKK